GMHELELVEWHARGLQHLDRGVESAGVPGHCNRHVAQLGETRNARILAHHDGAGTRGGVQPDDFSLAELLHALNRAPFTHWIDFERTLAQLRFLPALGKVLDPALDALGIVLVIFDIEPFVGKKALLDGDAPGAVMRIAVALQADGGRHGAVPYGGSIPNGCSIPNVDQGAAGLNAGAAWQFPRGRGFGRDESPCVLDSAASPREGCPHERG